jgi:hypothetical protein
MQSLESEVQRAIDKGAKICCIVMTEGTLRKKGLQSIATKILLQIIAKRGNILWVPRLSIDLEFSAMLVGF